MTTMTPATSDEKLMAALSYWGSLLWLFPALIIFLVKKDESAYVKKHALQSIALNVAMFAILWLGLSILGTVLGVITLGLGSALVLLIQTLAYLALLVYFIILGYQCYEGKDPSIPFITEWTNKQLG